MTWKDIYGTGHEGNMAYNIEYRTRVNDVRDVSYLTWTNV